MNICDAIELAEARLYNATYSEKQFRQKRNFTRCASRLWRNTVGVTSNEKPETLFAFRSDDIGKTVFLSDPDEMG